MKFCRFLCGSFRALARAFQCQGQNGQKRMARNWEFQLRVYGLRVTENAKDDRFPQVKTSLRLSRFHLLRKRREMINRQVRPCEGGKEKNPYSHTHGNALVAFLNSKIPEIQEFKNSRAKIQIPKIHHINHINYNNNVWNEKKRKENREKSLRIKGGAKGLMMNFPPHKKNKMVSNFTPRNAAEEGKKLTSLTTDWVEASVSNLQVAHAACPYRRGKLRFMIVII